MSKEEAWFRLYLLGLSKQLKAAPAAQYADEKLPEFESRQRAGKFEE